MIGDISLLSIAGAIVVVAAAVWIIRRRFHSPTYRVLIHSEQVWDLIPAAWWGSMDLAEILGSKLRYPETEFDTKQADRALRYLKTQIFIVAAQGDVGVDKVMTRIAAGLVEIRNRGRILVVPQVRRERKGE